MIPISCVLHHDPSIHLHCGVPHLTDIVVNALIVTKEAPETPPLASPVQRKLPTYFGQISLLHGPCSVIVSPSHIEVGNVVYRWPASSNTTTIQCGEWMNIEIVGHHHVTVTMQPEVVVRVLRHGVSESHPFKVDFLGFYIERGVGLSEFTHGLVGTLSCVVFFKR
jgi:Inter-alpha-trypsin inhibitor heavy chain C-terminus